MSNYVKSTNFASKDSLATGNPLKIVKGTEIDTEFNNIATAVATKADLNSPTFIGTPSAPTASAGTSTTQVATTAFVGTAVTNERTATATLTNKTLTSPTVTGGSFSSPAMTGTPTSPTAAAGTNTTQVATTAFVGTAVTNERTATATLTNKTLTSPTINGGTISGITDLAIADGGTGSSTAAGAFNNLKQNATESATGVVELATTSEAAAGTDTSRAVTPAGLEAHLLANGLGWNQTWQSVSRSSGTTYTNSTGRPIMVNLFSSLGANIYVNGVLVADGGGGIGDQVTISAIVPNGASYVCNGSFSAAELR